MGYCGDVDCEFLPAGGSGVGLDVTRLLDAPTVKCKGLCVAKCLGGVELKCSGFARRYAAYVVDCDFLHGCQIF